MHFNLNLKQNASSEVTVQSYALTFHEILTL